MGATHLGDGRTHFRVWAPRHDKVSVRIEGPEAREVELSARPRGFHEGVVEETAPGDRYFFRLGEELLRPDPASRAQPEGVHTASMVVDPRFDWTDADWRGIALEDYVFYEIHVGTFTDEGSFDAVIPHLDDLAGLGVTCLEIMPVAAFPGRRNWGYDGVQPYASQWSYGGVDGMRRLVDACHAKGLAVCLDVVYNHLGPEGNYLRDFGHYFTSRYGTPWGEALNFDDRHCDPVRHFFLENIRWWVEDVHVDALRFDAVHAIFDQSAWPFLAEAASTTRELGERLGRRIHAIAESDLHDPRMIRSPELGGFGMHSEWNDDLHHAVHSLLTGERSGYYADFGALSDLSSAYEKAYSHAGSWTPHRARRHGAPATGVRSERFVVCIQNHDQTGNRLAGERLSSLVSFESLKLAAGAMLLSPYLPLLFMGEEYGEKNPFLYFIDHGDPGLVEAVRKGRNAEFASFGWKKTPPDPASEATYEQSRLNRSLRETKEGRALLALYAELLKLRRRHPALGIGPRERLRATADEKQALVSLHRWSKDKEVLALFHFGEERARIETQAPRGVWSTVIDSADSRWEGPGSESPKKIDSDGEIVVEMLGRSLLLLDRQES